MRHKERYNSAKSHGSINLPWVADHITISNPSPNMVLVRTTGNDEPNTAQSSDIALLPFKARTYPVQSAQFGVRVAGFGVPLPSFSEAFPQDVELFFTAGEPPPTIADISLSTANSGVVLDTATGDSLIINHLDIPVPPSIHRLSVVPYVFSVADVTLDISGHQTGQLYYRSSGLSYSNRRPYVQISALDTSLDFIYTPLAAGVFTLTVLGFAEYGPIGVYRQDGRQVIDVIAPGSAALPVSFATPVTVTSAPAALPFGTVFPAAVRTTSPTFVLTNPGYSGLGLYLAVTIRPGAETITLVLYAHTALNNWQKYASVALGVSAGWVFHPGQVERLVGLVYHVADAAPDSILIQLQHSGAGNWTYSMEYGFIP